MTPSPTPSPEILDEILLSLVEGVGSRTYQRLIERFGNATAILNASRRDLSLYNFHQPNTLEQLLTARERINPVPTVELCQNNQIDIIPLQDERYPKQLKTIPDPPPLLYAQGTLLPSDAFSIAVIGTRQCSRYGKRQTEFLTKTLVQRGFAIISGLALGIDGAAHYAALQNKGKTIAVLGSGLLRVYPTKHKMLAKKIVQSGGCLLSELPPLHPPTIWSFPQRNRLVSGLSLGVLVVEAPLRSGTMITARLAGEQGRDIFAVPGSIDLINSQGCNQLIKDGAYLTESADDILNVLGPMGQSVVLPGMSTAMRHPKEISLNDVERRVLNCVGFAETSLDSIVSASGLELHQVLPALLVLKTKQIIRGLSTTRFVRM